MGLIKLNKTLWDNSFTIYKQAGNNKIAQHVVKVEDIHKKLNEFIEWNREGTERDNRVLQKAKELFGELMFM